MSTSILFGNIHRKFLLYADFLENSNSFGLTDEAIFAENHIQALLNIVFDWHLINANSIKKNQAGYDLVDSGNNTYIQVTSDKNHKVKHSNSLVSFRQIFNQNTEINNFIILFISKNVQKNLLAKVDDGILKYQAYDIPKLLDIIRFLDVEKLTKIDILLDSVIQPTQLNGKSKTKKEHVIPVQETSKIGSGIYIQRTVIIQNLYSFTQADNGLLTGGPGYGKSFIIDELQKKYYKENLPCYVIRINELLNGSSDEIGQILNSSKKWMQALKTIQIPANSKGLLIFDAFDTAKDENLKDEIFNLIKKGLKELADNWKILVSARTYDASKSIALQEVFPLERRDRDIMCRNFLIPDLTEGELENALRSKNLQVAAKRCTKELWQLLKTPYFLKIFEQILRSGNDDSSVVNTVETEAQLLEILWKTRIETNDSYDAFLAKLTSLLVKNDSLVCAKSEIIRIENNTTFKDLVSLNIIIEVAMKRNISFAHNILLEYAISKYFLDVDARNQILLIDRNPKLPFHFRQSFIYFYSQMWLQENNLFWEHYNQIKKQDTSLFRLFHHTVLNFILINFYKAPNELLPHLENSSPEVFGNNICRALETIRFIRKGFLLKQDVDLILETSKNINSIFLWEIGNLIEIGIEQFRTEEKPSIIKILSRASNNYLEFVLNNRYGLDGWLIDANGGYRGVQNVCSTFQYNKTQAKIILQKVLKLLKEKNFPIRMFNSLCENLVSILPIDTDFGFAIYKTLYCHNENSTEETSMGGGATMNLRSNRKQDYGHIHFMLEKKYSDLIRINPDRAIRLGIEIINKFSAGDGYSYQSKGYPVMIGKVNSVIKHDSGYYDEYDENGPVSFLKKIFDSLEKMSNEGKSQKQITEKLQLIVEIGGASKIWRQVLKFMCRYPERFTNLSIQFLTNLGLYECDETLHETGELIRAKWPFLNPVQQRKVESTIHSLNSSKVIYPELVKREIKRLLSCIPNELFTMPESGQFVADNGIGENPSIVGSRRPIAAQARYHTNEERMIYAGFDINNDEDKIIYPIYSEIESFNGKFENNIDNSLLKIEYKAVLPAMVNLFATASRGICRNERIKRSCDSEISRCARILSEVGKKLNEKEHRQVYNIAMFYINSSEYCSSSYENGELNNRHSIGSPTARTESVRTLQNLFYTFKAPELVDIILQLMSDNSMGIRYRALNLLDFLYEYDIEKFWNKVNERLIVENDGICLQKIGKSLNYEDIITKDLIPVYTSCNILLQKLSKADDSVTKEIWKDIVEIALIISLRHDRELGMIIIKNGLQIKEFTQTLVHTIRSVLNKYNEKKPYIKHLNKASVLFDILQEVLKFRFAVLSQIGIQSPDAINDFELIDLVIHNIYFAYEFDTSNNTAKKLSRPEKEAFYKKIKPLLDFTANESLKIGDGFMVAHTGLYFMQLLNELLTLEPDYILKLSNTIVVCAAKNNFTYDRMTLSEIVKLTESIIANHRTILKNKRNFLNLIEILDQFATSGHQEAIELTWRLKDAF